MTEKDDRSASTTRRRPPRWLVAILVVIVALPLAGAAVLKAMFPPERLREIAEPQIEKRIARDVSLGDVRLKVFPNIAIRLSEVAIANPTEGFSDSPAVRMDALDLRLDLLPLLRRQFRLSQLRLVGPRIRYEVAADGSNNLAGLLAADTAGAAHADSARDAERRDRSSSFEIRDLAVVDGSLAYVNSETRRAARLAFEGRLDVDPSEREDGPSASGGGAHLSEIVWIADGRDTTRVPDVDVTYRAVFEPGGGRVAVPELAVRAAGLELTGEAASRRDSASGARSVRVELASGEFALPDLMSELPEGVVPDTFGVEGRARLDLRMAGELGGDPGPRLDGSAEYRDVSVTTPGRGRVAEAVGGTLAFTTSGATAPDVSGRLFGRPFEARVEVTGLTEPSPTLDAHLSGEFGLAQLDEFREGPALPLEGDLSVAIDASGPAKAMDRWTLSGPVRLSNVVWSHPSLPRPARIAAATMRLTGSGVRGDAVPVTIGDSDLAVTFSGPELVRYYLTDESARGAPPLVEFTARSRRLAAADLRTRDDEPGYSDLLTARLAGARVGGRDPESIARERYRKPDLSSVRASGTVSIVEWVNPPTNASDVSFRVDVSDGLVEVSDVSGDVYGGRLSGGMQLDLAGQEPPYELEYDFQLRGAGAGSLLERWTRLGRA
ncbi:MAG: AsmA family protein, partial [Gemmatimonadota bacterium]